MLTHQELENYLKDFLKCEEFSDYGPNGLQVQGREKIQKIAFAVSATQKSIQQTIESGADTLIVHHGLFWVFHGHRPITGPFAKRVKPLIQNEINLFGYHLPLDAHPEIGNAAALAYELGLEKLSPFGDYKGAPLGVQGHFPTAQSPQTLKEELEKILSHTVIHAQAQKAKINSMGIITGGANSAWKDAWKEGLDSYLTGEISEHDWHESAEAGVHMFAGGHNATESLGIQKLQEHLSQKFDVETIYFPSQNPA